MKTEKSSSGNYSGRFRELQERFSALEPEIDDSNTKKALSLINGMLQELWRNLNSTVSAGDNRNQLKFSDIASMYRHAPKMEGKAINTPLPVGTKAPELSLPDANGNIVSLADLRGSTVLLVFYPLDWSPGCSQQLDLYQNEWNEFESRNIKVLGISVDSIYSHGAWAAVRNIKFPLLSDFNPKAAVAKKYNVYREPEGFTERALYIIDGNGVIRYSFVSPYIHHVPDIYELFKKMDEINKPITV